MVHLYRCDIFVCIQLVFRFFFRGQKPSGLRIPDVHFEIVNDVFQMREHHHVC